MSSLGITASSVHRASSSRDNPGNKKQWIKPHSTMVGESQNGRDEKSHPLPRFSDNRWKNGSWDLNVFVRNGRMDWDSVIVAEARRRKCLEVFPEAAMNQEPVLFRSSIIPWWPAWIMHSHLPQAEILNVQGGQQWLDFSCHIWWMF
ncbi:unnamed protein product [Cuscuta epithymum]|uniref:Uncharacterized protein n=1 Tax=Cuscuta epithymum TaxID=186058 RepID=A0AAV0FVX2_9ASTE|nr:unnamed protein product [Cuscuta epithymum]